MGEIFEGYDERLDRPVALKRILPDAQDPEKARARFRREARAVARLSHSAIVQVHDWIEDDSGDWIVMELVDGRSLTEVLADGPLIPRRAAQLAREIAAGLAVAHRNGIVHRDLKAENVMVTVDDEVKILDFGIAKSFRKNTGPSLSTLTEDGKLVGSVGAMSPERTGGWVTP